MPSEHYTLLAKKDLTDEEFTHTFHTTLVDQKLFLEFLNSKIFNMHEHTINQFNSFNIAKKNHLVSGKIPIDIIKNDMELIKVFDLCTSTEECDRIFDRISGNKKCYPQLFTNRNYIEILSKLSPHMIERTLNSLLRNPLAFSRIIENKIDMQNLVNIIKKKSDSLRMLASLFNHGTFGMMHKKAHAIVHLMAYIKSHRSPTSMWTFPEVSDDHKMDLFRVRLAEELIGYLNKNKKINIYEGINDAYNDVRFPELKNIVNECRSILPTEDLNKLECDKRISDLKRKRSKEAYEDDDESTRLHKRK